MSPCSSSGMEDSVEELDLPGLRDLTPPQVAHVFIGLSHNSTNQLFKVKALHDSGCAKTIIHENTFQLIPNYKQIKVTKLPNIFISSCTGERTNVQGTATINLTFMGENGKKITFPHDVLIHNSLEHDFLLGRDFTGSPVKVLETNKHIYLTNKPELNSIENLWNKHKNDLVNVPIIGNSPVTNSVQTNLEAWIPP